MTQPLVHRAFVPHSFSRRVLGPVLAVAAIVACTVALPTPCAARIAGEETKPPLEQEEERQTQEQSLPHAGGRQRLKAHSSLRRINSATRRATGPRYRPRWSKSCDGHRLSNGLTAPLVC